MRRIHCFTLLALSAFALSACGDHAEEGAGSDLIEETKGAPESVAKADTPFQSLPAKVTSPFHVDYKIIGTPIVGSPLSVDLRIESVMGAAPVKLDYRIQDLASMSFHEAQPRSLTVAPAANEKSVTERVTLIPQREGRLYFNVSASVDTDSGSISSVIAIPIHVGSVSTDPVEHGVIEADETGEPVRVLTPE